MSRGRNDGRTTIVWQVMEGHDLLGASLDYETACAFSETESYAPVVDVAMRPAEAEVVLARHPINAIEVLDAREKRRKAHRAGIDAYYERHRLAGTDSGD